MDGLRRDQTRPPAVVERVVEMTLQELPGETTPWSRRTLAAATGVSVASVQRLWRAHGLQPHRIRTFKLSCDPKVSIGVEN